MKYSPRTFENVKMSSLHFLSYIVIISGVIRGLNQGGKLREKRPLAIVRSVRSVTVYAAH